METGACGLLNAFMVDLIFAFREMPLQGDKLVIT
jgi:hypothetical protein